MRLRSRSISREAILGAADTYEIVEAYPQESIFQAGSPDAQEAMMKCQTCGSRLRAAKTDLPFKVTDRSTVIIKQVPVLQCESCPEYLLEDSVMAAVDAILARVDPASEVEVVPFAA